MSRSGFGHSWVSTQKKWTLNGRLAGCRFWRWTDWNRKPYLTKTFGRWFFFFGKIGCLLALHVQNGTGQSSSFQLLTTSKAETENSNRRRERMLSQQAGLTPWVSAVLAEVDSTRKYFKDRIVGHFYNFLKWVYEILSWFSVTNIWF